MIADFCGNDRCHRFARSSVSYEAKSRLSLLVKNIFVANATKGKYRIVFSHHLLASETLVKLYRVANHGWLTIFDHDKIASTALHLSRCHVAMKLLSVKNFTKNGANYSGSWGFAHILKVSCNMDMVRLCHVGRYLNMGHDDICTKLLFHCLSRDLVLCSHRVRGLTGILHRLSSELHLAPDQERAETRDYERRDGGNKHPHRPQCHILLSDQIPQSVFARLFGCGLLAWGSRFLIDDLLFDRKRDRWIWFAALLPTVSCLLLGRTSVSMTIH